MLHILKIDLLHVLIILGDTEVISDKCVTVKLEIEPEKTLLELGAQRRAASIIAEGSLKIDTHKCTFPGCNSKGNFSTISTFSCIQEDSNYYVDVIVTLRM